MLPDRSPNPTLPFLCPLPSSCGGASRRERFAERTVELFPTPLPVAEFGATLEPDGSLLADIEGDGEEVEELIPFVWMPGGTGRFILEDIDCIVVADGAICISTRVRWITDASGSATRSQLSHVIGAWFLFCPSNIIQGCSMTFIRCAECCER
jgi:hypothetical protein